MSNIYYCAYGSNLNQTQMKNRCPDAKIVSTGVIEGYELEFNKVANIVPKKNANVPVCVYTISDKDEKSLDSYEGYPLKYIKKALDVKLDNGKTVNAMVYVRRGRPEIEPPSDEYYQRIETGYQELGFDVTYLDDIYEKSIEGYNPYSYYDNIFDNSYHNTKNQYTSDNDLVKAFIVGETYERLGFEKTTLEEKAMIAKLINKYFSGPLSDYEKFCEDYLSSFLENNPNEKIEYQRYIAYGSNMNLEEMRSRCPNSKVVGVGRLNGYELKFNYCATIKKNPEEYTPVVIWDIHPKDWESLDSYEGYPSLYRRENVTVNYQGEKTQAIVYVMNVDDNIYSMPSKSYYERVKQGYIDNCISTMKLTQALAKAKEEEIEPKNVYVMKGRKSYANSK